MGAAPTVLHRTLEYELAPEAEDVWIVVSRDIAIRIGVLIVVNDDRITSYNVCYTKLLRRQIRTKYCVLSEMNG